MSPTDGEIASLRIDRTHGGYSGGLLDFSTSLNPLGPPPAAIDAYQRAAAKIAAYPSAYPRALEAQIGSWLNIDPAYLIVGNGSTQLIYLVARLLQLKSPFVAIPTFSEIANALIAAGSQPFPITLAPEMNFRFQFEALRNALEGDADGVFLGRPNSPTGALIGLEETAAIARECDRRGVWCVVDEAFIEFADDPGSAASLVGSISKLVVLRSLTKIFAIPGLRLGYLLGPADFVRRLRDVIEPWSVNAAAEHVALACMQIAEPFITESRQLIREERHLLERGLSCRLGAKVFPSAANFLMFVVGSERRRGEFGHYMLNQGIAIRDLSALPGCGPGFYRIGVRSRPDNDRLVVAAADYPQS